MCTGNDPLERYATIRQVFQMLSIFGNILGLVVIFLLAVYLSDYGGGYSWNNIGGSFNLHILLMTIFLVCLQADGFVDEVSGPILVCGSNKMSLVVYMYMYCFLLYFLGSLVYRICPTAPKYTAKIIHSILHGISLVGMCVGLAAAINAHNLSNSPHFYTLHSWIGIVTISFFLIQFFIGFCTFLLPITSLECKITVLPLHKFLGKSLFICTIGTALTGLMQKGSSLGASYSALTEAAMILNFAALVLVIFGVVMVYLVGNHAFRRRPRAELEPLLIQPSTSAGFTTKTYTIYK